MSKLAYNDIIKNIFNKRCEGLSLREVSNYLKNVEGVAVSHSSIYRIINDERNKVIVGEDIFKQASNFKYESREKSTDNIIKRIVELKNNHELSFIKIRKSLISEGYVSNISVRYVGNLYNKYNKAYSNIVNPPEITEEMLTNPSHDTIIDIRVKLLRYLDNIIICRERLFNDKITSILEDIIVRSEKYNLCNITMSIYVNIVSLINKLETIKDVEYILNTITNITDIIDSNNIVHEISRMDDNERKIIKDIVTRQHTLQTFKNQNLATSKYEELHSLRLKYNILLDLTLYSNSLLEVKLL